MPKETKRSSKSLKKPKKPSCGLEIKTKGNGTALKISGPHCNGILLLTSDDCVEQAQLAADVAYNTCVFNGGTEEHCQQVKEETYQQVYDECMGD